MQNEDGQTTNQPDVAANQDDNYQNTGAEAYSEDYRPSAAPAAAAAATTQPTEWVPPPIPKVGGQEGEMLFQQIEGEIREVASPTVLVVKKRQRRKKGELTVHDMKWNKHIEGLFFITCSFLCRAMLLLTVSFLMHLQPELKAFKMLYGHINVPRKEEHKRLYKFLDNQVQNYRFLIEGKKSTLTVQRIRDLDEVSSVQT
jgi:hypothetical protein